jgi:hypothetical protein
MVTVQQQINNELDRLHADLKKLRNEYLHWNAHFGSFWKLTTGVLCAHKPTNDGKRNTLDG